LTILKQVRLGNDPDKDAAKECNAVLGLSKCNFITVNILKILKYTTDEWKKFDTEPVAQYSYEMKVLIIKLSF